LGLPLGLILIDGMSQTFPGAIVAEAPDGLHRDAPCNVAKVFFPVKALL
jgi:hypothetical protein